MRVGVVSDVHNNVEALSYALDHLSACELILNLGDLVSQYRVTPEIIRLSRETGMLGILGNHEKCVLSPAASAMRSRLAQKDLNFLEALPAQRTLQIDGRRVLVVHGSPWDDPADISCTYVFEHDPRSIDRLGEAEADILLLGHTHVAMATRVGGMLALNPGSCGEARDRARRLSFAELDFDAGSAAVYEVRPGQPPEAFLQVPL
jgi:putative phosphoesterase